MIALQANSEIYRKYVKANDLNIQRVMVKESDLFVSGVVDLSEKAMALLIKCRKILETYIEKNPSFKTAMQPIGMDEHAPDMVKTMMAAGMRAGVGPMASVAGIIAEYVGTGLLPYSSEVIVENGGDVFVRSEKKREFMILAETSSFLGLRVGIEPSQHPTGICTSSGLLGHSISYGKADAVMVRAKSVALADASATAIANIVKTGADINRAIDKARQLGAEGLVVIADETMGAWGNIEILS